MNQPKTINFQGTNYFDDRLFVLYLCPGTVEIQDDGMVVTTIYHEQAPVGHVWCVVTYRNTNRYPLHRVDIFYKKDDAINYIKKIEPETPLISLGGKSPDHPMSFEEYSRWKKENGFKDYDWKSLYSHGGSNARENIFQTKEQFGDIR
jgi:hypothetical protein